MKKVLLLFLMIISLKSYADLVDKDSNLCNLLTETIKKTNQNTSSEINANIPRSWYTDTGIRFKRDSYYTQWSSEKDEDIHYYKRTKDNNILLDFVSPKARKHLVIPESEVIEINDKKVSRLNDKEIIQMEDDVTNSIKLKLFDALTGELKEVKIDPETDAEFWFYVDASSDSYDELDSKTSKFTTNFQVFLLWYLNDKNSPKLLNELSKKFDALKDKLHPSNQNGFGCSFYDGDYEALNLYQPVIVFHNQLSSEAQKNIMEYFNISYFRDANYLAITKITEIKSGVFKNNFSFSSFPLDSQVLKYELIFPSGYKVIPKVSPLEIYKSKWNKFDEWQIVSHDYEAGYISDARQHSPIVVFKQIIERNYSYYFTKILLPILIILMMSWSVFWINPRELEARLTVSIVCLLSLIAYTFIIDNDIPKLNYLTLLDCVILLSYFFSIISTIQSIAVRNIFDQDFEKAKIYDVKFRKYVPISYFILLLIIFAVILNKSSNTAQAFKGLLNWF